MFKFVKNLGKKNKIVSTEFMSWDDFVKEIEPRILEDWTDHELVEKAGIVGMFTENVKITKDLSYEELCDCIVRSWRMIEIGTDTVCKFSDIAISRKFTSRENYKRFLDEKASGKNKGSFAVRDEFFSAKTLVALLNDNNKSEQRVKDEIPENKAKALEYLNGLLLDLHVYRKMFWMRVEATLIANSAIMTGFDD